MRRRGFSLIELVVYTGLVLLVGMLLAQLYSLSRQTQRTTASAYAVTGQTDTAIDWIRRDLQSTALASVQCFSGTRLAISPCISMSSARVMAGSDLQTKLLISEYGAPAWTYHVYYGLRSNRGDQTGSLVRWEIPYPTQDQDRLPKLATMPTSLAQVKAPRVILQHVLCPGRRVERLGGLNNGWRATGFGGFRVQFVRRRGGENGEEYLTVENPSQSTGGADNTRLIEVELCVSEPSGGAPNFYNVKFRCAPRY